MPNTEKRSARAKLFWFVTLWAAGVLSVAAFAYGLRALLGL
ncbi:MAG: DUF2474 domain-containing protein [Parvibaculum sp.]